MEVEHYKELVMKNYLDTEYKGYKIRIYFVAEATIIAETHYVEWDNVACTDWKTDCPDEIDEEELAELVAMDLDSGSWDEDAYDAAMEKGGWKEWF